MATAMNFEQLFPSDELISIRRDFHQYPEPSCREFRTSEKICEILEGWGITDYRKGLAVTGITVDFRGNRPGKNIAVRADMDALDVTEENDFPYKSTNPGAGHVCGHDIHMTILLGLAKYLHSLNHDFPGFIRLVFQPAEEATGGAKRLIQEEHVLENPKIDYCLGLHVHPYFPVGQVGLRHDTMYAATNGLKLTVHGKSAHAATPENGIDSVVMAAHVIVNAQTVVSRMTSPQDSVIVSFGKIHGGEVRNQIPDHVIIEGTLRTMNPESRKKALLQLERITTNTAEAFGGNLQFEYDKNGYTALINDNATVDYLRKVAEERLGADNVFMEPASTTYGEDFAYFAEACPSMFWHLGCRRPDGDVPTESLHSSRFNPDEGCIRQGVELQAAFALALAGKV